MRPRFASMTVGLTVGITAAVMAACGIGGYFYSAHHFETQLEMARTAALAKGELIRAALEHQMMENDRSLIARMIESFGRQPRVESVVLLDRDGVPKYSGGVRQRPEDLQIHSPTCQACHRLPPEQRGSSRVIETRGGEVLRTVVPVRNAPQCQRCHDPNHKINGILILDYSVEETRAAMAADLRWLVLGSGAMALFLVGSLAVIIHFAVVRRLRRFETTARMIAGGDLKRRVPVRGSDTLAWMAREFNTLADSVTGLVEEVRNQRERLEIIINSIDDGIVVLDAERKILAANDAFLLRVGHVRDNVMGLCCRDLEAGGCTITDCPSLACLRSGSRQVRICERQKPDGTVMWEEVHASPVLDPAGHLKQVVEVWRDISERRAAEAHLAESHRLASVGMLASGFSHEMNTPLATVLTCVEGILREVGLENGQFDYGRIKDNASVAREQILRCRGITQHFLRLSRNQRPIGDIVDLRAAAEKVQRLIEPTAREHSVTVEVQAEAPGIRVRADEAELQHALINLTLNAVQACEAGGRVVTRLCVRGGARIRISDNGCGIPPEHLKRIFEPFFGLREGGTGLGLFLALNFVRRWGGDILVESTAGVGSVFEIVLPVLDAAQNPVTVK